MESSGRPEAWEAAKLADSRHEWQQSAALWATLYGELTSAEDRRVAGLQAAAAFRKAGDFANAATVVASLVEAFPSAGRVRRELARLEDNLAQKRSKSAYWYKRQNYIYLLVLKQIATRIAANANVVLDVGSNATPVLEWFPAVPTRFSVDLKKPYRAAGVTSFTGDFLAWTPPLRRIDVGLCLQVLEHVGDPAAFARKLLSLCDVCIISVPYKWPAGAVKYHIHDPVDKQKMRKWSDRAPNYTYVVSELFGEQRLICVYDKDSGGTWRNVSGDEFRYRWSLRGSEAVLAPPTAADPRT